MKSSKKKKKRNQKEILIAHISGLVVEICFKFGM